jgi:hypothetical protein
VPTFFSPTSRTIFWPTRMRLGALNGPTTWNVAELVGLETEIDGAALSGGPAVAGGIDWIAGVADGWPHAPKTGMQIASPQMRRTQPRRRRPEHAASARHGQPRV